MPHTSARAAEAAARQHISRDLGEERGRSRPCWCRPVDRLALRRSVTAWPGPGADPGCGPVRAAPRAWSSSAIRGRGACPCGPARVGFSPDQGLDVLAAVSGHRRRVQPGRRRPRGRPPRGPGSRCQDVFLDNDLGPLVRLLSTPPRPGRGRHPHRDVRPWLPMRGFLTTSPQPVQGRRGGRADRLTTPAALAPAVASSSSPTVSEAMSMPTAEVCSVRGPRARAVAA